MGWSKYIKKTEDLGFSHIAISKVYTQWGGKTSCVQEGLQVKTPCFKD